MKARLTLLTLAIALLTSPFAGFAAEPLSSSTLAACPQQASSTLSILDPIASSPLLKNVVARRCGGCGDFRCFGATVGSACGLRGSDDGGQLYNYCVSVGTCSSDSQDNCTCGGLLNP
jgi:hypothetical protein